MKKVILTEDDKKAIISEKERLIIENFSKEFNKIKRIDENNLNPYNFQATLIMNPNKWEEFKDFAHLSEIWDQENNITKLYIGQHLVGTYHPKFGRLDYNRGSELDKRAQEFKFDRNN